jgi:hypothetical protein
MCMYISEYSDYGEGDGGHVDDQDWKRQKTMKDCPQERYCNEDYIHDNNVPHSSRMEYGETGATPSDPYSIYGSRGVVPGAPHQHHCADGVVPDAPEYPDNNYTNNYNDDHDSCTYEDRYGNISRRHQDGYQQPQPGQRCYDQHNEGYYHVQQEQGQRCDYQESSSDVDGGYYVEGKSANIYAYTCVYLY